jgi:1-phosphofructokinase/tagatose 6-phosphate kinase
LDRAAGPGSLVTSVILTVTLNAAIDRTVAVPSFRLGERHRAVEARSIAGGKGVNVARALKLLGRPVIAAGLTGGATGNRLLEQLNRESVMTAFTRIAGESRTNLAVIDPTSGEQTEINERGPKVSAEEVDLFMEKLLYLAQGASICVLAGSVPPGAPADVYARLITELRAMGVLTVLDADGEQMRAGLRAGPNVVAPNIGEAEEAVGHEFNDDDDDLALGLAGLLEMGAGEAIITTESGCVAIVGEAAERRRFEARIDQLEPVVSVGSGDCFLAGYVAARYQGASPRECLAFGVACGAESTQHFGAGTLDRREVERLLGRVEVRELDVPAGVP